MNKQALKLRSSAARAAHRGGASPRFARPAMIASISALLLSACSSLDMQGTNPNDYFAAHPIENKVGAKGELISPSDCPNWKKSPVTNYSNTKQANLGCATVTNLGLMLENPRDLERGASGGKITPDATRSSEAIKNYRSGLTGLTAPTTTTTTVSGQ